MSQPTKIEWVQNADGSQGMSWNFLRGCSRVSEGCGIKGAGGCYAERQAMRFAGPGQPYEGLVRMTPNGPRWTGEVSFHEHILLEPLKRRKPTKYFVNSMSDLFHEKVTDEMLDKAFAVMALTPQHTYQILTKRPERMREYLSQHDVGGRWAEVCNRGMSALSGGQRRITPDEAVQWTNSGLSNCHLGVSVEDQKTADERIPLLLQTPAAVRWVSYEPALGPVDLRNVRLSSTQWIDVITGLYGGDHSIGDCKSIDWIVVGGESGPGARPFDIQWARDIIAQCKAAGVPVFVKQLGADPRGICSWGDHDQSPPMMLDNDGVLSSVSGEPGTLCHAADDAWWPCSPKLKSKKGGDPSEWPADLRVREFPNV